MDPNDFISLATKHCLHLDRHQIKDVDILLCDNRLSKRKKLEIVKWLDDELGQQFEKGREYGKVEGRDSILYEHKWRWI